jgi:hypothetical protein
MRRIEKMFINRMDSYKLRVKNYRFEEGFGVVRDRTS